MMKYSTEWRTLFTGGDDVKSKGAHFAHLWDPTYPNLAAHCLLKKFVGKNTTILYIFSTK